MMISYVAGDLRPRRPVVCLIDATGITLAMCLLAVYRPSAVATALPVAVIVQLAVSMCYHWLPESDTWGKLDHATIFFTIGASFVAFWGTFLPSDEAIWRLTLIAGIVAIGCAVKVVAYLPRVASAAVYFGAGAPVAYSLSEFPQWLSSLDVALFWGGVGLYVMQLGVFTAKWPDPYPEHEGYRVIQHVILLGAFATHMWIVVRIA